MKIVDKNLCTGCETCAQVCHRKAISMVEDNEGFKYPKINSDLCNNCKSCIRKCPVHIFDDKKSGISSQISTYAYRSRSKQRYNSSSGGVFFDLASQWVEDGGIVVGASFNEEFELNHTIAKSVDELYPLMGSKYLQSNINDIYIKVKEYLKEEYKVLFFGMTCQIEGLLSYVGNVPNLYCVDLICMGIPSPKVWDKYIDTFFEKRNISSVNYKNKDLGWHKFSFKLINKDGSIFSEYGFDNYYMECMFKGYTIRPSCYNCKFKCENKKSDLTIADCWGCENYLSEFDDDKGLSMIISHTEKGEKLVNKLHCSGEIRKMEYNNVLKYNPNYQNRIKRKYSRTLFYMLVWKYPIFTFKLFGLNPQKSILARIMRKIGV